MSILARRLPFAITDFGRFLLYIAIPALLLISWSGTRLGWGITALVEALLFFTLLGAVLADDGDPNTPDASVSFSEDLLTVGASILFVNAVLDYALFVLITIAHFIA